MSINADTFSGRQFLTYYASDDPSAGVGTFNAVALGADFRRLDADSPVVPNFNLTQEFEMRAGDGRIAKEGDIFVSEKGVVREFTIQGRLTEEDLSAFLQNILGIAVVSDVLTVPTGTAPAGLLSGASITSGDMNKTLSFYFKSPLTGKSWQFPGCICTNLKVKSVQSEASGRHTFEATFKTGWLPTQGDITSFAGDEPSGNVIYLNDMTERQFGGTADGLLMEYGLEINAPVQFLGQQGANGDPQLVARQIPELEIKFNAKTKFDTNTEAAIAKYKSATSVVTYIGETALVSGDLPAPATGNNGLCILAKTTKMTKAEPVYGDIATVDLEIKAVDDGSTNVFEVLLDF